MIYAVTRDPNSKSAVKLSEKPAVRVIKGNLDEAQALFTTANAPIWGVFCVTVPMGSGQTPQSEERQGMCSQTLFSTSLDEQIAVSLQLLALSSAVY